MLSRIEINPNVCHGKPVIKGTRVLVSNILCALGAGDSFEEVLEDYPNIASEDIYAAMAFGSQLAQFEELPYRVHLPYETKNKLHAIPRQGKLIIDGKQYLFFKYTSTANNK